MTNEREYFSAFSRDNGVFQSPKASNICFGRQAPLTSHSASPSLPAQGKGHLSIHGRTFWYLPLSFPQPLLSFLGPQCPCALAGLPQVPSGSPPQGWPTPCPSTTATYQLRSRRLALGTHTGLLIQPKVQTCFGDFGWVLQYSKETVHGGPCMFASNLQITTYFNLLPNLTLRYIFLRILYTYRQWFDGIMHNKHV